LGLKLTFKEPYDLGHTFECGQLFRFATCDNGRCYYGPLKDRILKISQENAQTLTIESDNMSGLEPIVKRFLRVTDDYHSIQNSIMCDDLMKKIVQTTNGLHLLLQDLFECTISFFLSQCSNIPRITQNLVKIAELYGTAVEFDKKTFYLFPSKEDMADITEQELRDLKFGYRAKYIANFIHHYPEFFDKPPTDSQDLNVLLQSVEGIGQKVADCIQLFAFGDISVFPVDTWMEKFILKYYSHGQKLNIKQIREIGKRLFGKYAGYAQEFIFRYARCYDPLL